MEVVTIQGYSLGHQPYLGGRWAQKNSLWNAGQRRLENFTGKGGEEDLAIHKEAV